jgi:hypothetical protein
VGPGFRRDCGFYFWLSVLGYDPSSIQETPMADLLESAENGIVTLTLNRPERLNALSPDMTAALK